MKRKHAIIGRFIVYPLLALLAFLYLQPVLFPRPLPVPKWKARQVIHNVPLLKPGMSEPEVWSALGLAWWGYHEGMRVSVSGDPKNMPISYAISPEYVLTLRWNRNRRPAVLVSARTSHR